MLLAFSWFVIVCLSEGIRSTTINVVKVAVEVMMMMVLKGWRAAWLILWRSQIPNNFNQPLDLWTLWVVAPPVWFFCLACFLPNDPVLPVLWSLDSSQTPQKIRSLSKQQVSSHQTPPELPGPPPNPGQPESWPPVCRARTQNLWIFYRTSF